MTTRRPRWPATAPGQHAGLTAAALAAVLVLLTALSTFVTATPARASSGDYSTPLTIELTGAYGDNPARSPRTGLVVGTVASAWTSSGSVVTNPYGFTFTAGCTVGRGIACTTLGTTMNYRWDFGDGTTASATAPSTSHVYTRPGRYTVNLTVDNRPAGTTSTAAYTGTAQLAVLVSPRYADVDAADSTTGKTSPVDSEQIWSVSALGLLSPCRTYFPSATTHVTGEQQGDTGRAEFCPQAPATRALAAPPGATGATTFTTNAITGAACLSSPGACGLPADVFAENASTPGDPTLPCSSACQARLKDLGMLTDTGEVVYRNAVCEDNQVAVRNQSTLASGVELGCFTYGEFLTALGRAVDSSGDSGTLAADCAATPGADRQLRRAAALLAPHAADLGTSWAVRVCDAGAALTKREAYALLAAAAGTPADTSTPVLSQLRDLADPTLQGGATADPMRPVVGGALAAGAPLVGDLDCADKRLRQANGADPKSCFNGTDALSRRDAAQLLAFLVLSPDAGTGALRATLTASGAATELGRPVQVTLTATTPKWYPVDANLTIKWSPTPYGSLACGTQTAAVTSSRKVVRSCVFTPNQDPGAAGVTLSATVTDDQGSSAVTATTKVAVVNDPPAFASANSMVLSPTTPLEGDVVTGTLGYRDPQGNPVTFGVRSCIPALDGAGTCVSTASTFPRNANKARVSTNDNSSATFTDAAPTDLGTVQVSSVTSSTVTFKHTSYNPDNNGRADFVLQMCDSGNACTSRYITFALAAVNDAPAPLALVTAKTYDSAVTATMGGTDAKDVGQPGYPTPANPIGMYQVCSVPSATDAKVEVWNGTAWATASAGTTTTDPRLRVTPVTGRYTTTTATYKVQDVGAPGAMWSGGTAACTAGTSSVVVTNADPGTAPVAVLTVTPSVVEAYSGDVTASASGSTGTDLTGYTFDWGDGTITGPQASPTATHRYTTSSDITPNIKLTVTDAQGRTGTKTSLVNVKRNLIGNPTFESGADRVQGLSGTTVTTAAAAAHGGTQGLRATGSGTTCVITDNPASVVGASLVGTYTYKTWVSPAAGAVGKTLTATLVETSAGAEVKRSSRTLTLASGWQPISTTLDAAGAGHDISFTLSLAGLSSTGCLDVDDMSLTGPTGTANTYAATVLADSPTAYYRLDDDATSTIALDSSGNGRNATVSGPVGFGTTSPATGAGTAIKPTSNARVTTSNTGLDATMGAKSTIEFWTDYASYQNLQMAFTFGNLDLYMASNKLSVNTYASDLYGTSYDLIGTGRHHIALVVTNGNVGATKLYVDGRLMPMTQIQGTPQSTASVGGTLQIGGGISGNYPWTQSLDEFAMYRGELSQSRILAHYAAGADDATSSVLADSPMAFYRLDELSGTVAQDSSGNNRDGAYGGTPVMAQSPVSGSGRSVNFNGAGWVDTATLPVDTSATGKTSVEMWLDMPAAQSAKMPFGFNSYDLFANGGALGFNSGAGDTTGVPFSTIGFGRHHVVAVFANGDPAGRKLYIDGTLQAMTTVSGTAAARTVSPTARIAAWVNGTSPYVWPYRVDEVAIYNGELAPERVQAHYTASR